MRVLEIAGRKSECAEHTWTAGRFCVSVRCGVLGIEARHSDAWVCFWFKSSDAASPVSIAEVHRRP